MIKIQNLISRISVPPFQKQQFVDVPQIKCSPAPFQDFTKKTFSLLCLLQPVLLARDLVRLIKEKVCQGTWNLSKIDDKDIKKEHDKDMLTVHQKNTWKKVLEMLQFVNNETQSLPLIFNRFHILLQAFCCWLWVKICFLGKVSQWFERQQCLFYTISSKQIHSQQQEP